MAFVNHPMTHEIAVDPSKALEKLATAFRDAGCNQKVAAERLGCREETFIRWVARLDKLLGGKARKRLDTIKATAVKQGWHHGGKTGRPKGSKDRATRRRRAA